MMHKRLLLFAFVLVLALSAFALPVAADEYEIGRVSGGNTPASTAYYPGTSPVNLSLPGTVYVLNKDTGRQSFLSSSGRTFQWYQADSADATTGTAIEEATSASYAPPIDTAGTFYYYGEFKQTYQGSELYYKTNMVTLTVATEWPEEPEITTWSAELSEAEVKYTQGETAAMLRAPSSFLFQLSDNSTIATATPTFRWYKKTNKEAATGTLIEGANYSYYTPPVTELGTTYYYCVATGTGYDWTYVSKMAMITVVEPEIPEASGANGFLTEIGVKTSSSGMATYLPGYSFDPETAEYDVTLLDVGAPVIYSVSTPHTRNSHYFFETRWNGVNIAPFMEYAYINYDFNRVRSNALNTVVQGLNYGESGVYSVITGKRIDTNGDGAVKRDDDYDAFDAYNFTFTLKPGFSTLTLTDGEGTNLPLTPAYGNDTMYQKQDFYAVTDGDTVKLNANFNFGKGVKAYIGDNTTAHTAAINGESIDLTQYRGEGDVAVIPLKLVWGEGSKQVTNTYKLHIGPAKYLPVITENLDTTAVVIDKDTKTPLKVTAEVEEGTLTYQWYSGDEFANIDTMKPIEGATSASYEASPSNYAQNLRSTYINTGTRWYACRVTNTVNGETFTVNSAVTPVKCNQTYLNPPEILLQPGIGTNGRTDYNVTGLIPYQKEYLAGEPLADLFFYIKGCTDNLGEERNVWHTESDGKLSYEVYLSDQDGEPDEEKDLKFVPRLAGGSTSTAYLGPQLRCEEGLPVGEWYVTVKVIATSVADPEMSAYTYTEPFKIKVTAPDIALEGAGTVEDPYLLKTADDFDYVREVVNDLDYSMTGLYLKMTNDITLNEEWTSIGDDIKVPFSAVLDGDGHTLSYQKGSKPLFEYTLDATVKNLGIYGEEIDGCGLVNNYPNSQTGHTVVTLDGVTLKAGTSTRQSGLAKGSYYSLMGLKVSNCVAEEGVVIGYDKSQSQIATFVSLLVGTVENCKSAATVYGVDSVGGIVAYGGNAMGLNSVRNCEFSGKIEATGRKVGGILGSGYQAVTAPNGRCASINNCLSIGDITGATYVGGIFGADAGVEQAWDNGVGTIRNNLFYGTVKATAIDGVAGGIIGHMCSLNRHNVIENNYFLNTCGAENGIGSVTHIDTSAIEYGKHDGVFYYDTSKDDLNAIKLVVDGPEDEYMSVAKRNMNRDDDPLGKDADKLAKAVTQGELTGDTVIKALNDNEYSLHNWVKNGEGYPVLSEDAIALSLEIGGDFKTIYYIGDDLDLSGIKFTVTWSDGNVTHPTLDDVSIVGFDSSKRAALTLVASVDGVSAEIPVKVVIKPASNEITVYFTLLGDKIHDAVADEDYHLYETDTLTPWIERMAVTVDMNATVLDVFDQVLTEKGYSYTNDRGDYIAAITTPDDVTLAEFTNGPNSGWMYTLNKRHSQLSVVQQFLEDGDEIVFHYSDDYKQEEKREKAAEYVDSLIDKIGDVSLDSEEAITTAKEAFDKLSDAEKEFVEKKDVLDAAVVKLAQLKGDKAAADTVQKAISALPAADKLTAADKDAVDKAKAAYDALTDAQKALVPEETKKALDDAVAAVAKAVDDKAAADAVKEAIEALPATDKLTANDKAAVEKARADYDKLSDAQKALVGDEAKKKLADAEAKIKELDPKPQFVDVPANAYFKEAVDWAVSHEPVITTGTDATHFTPNGDCTRGQVVTFLWRAAGTPEPTSTTNPFVDVPANQYYYKAVLWAVEKGITTGTDKTHFTPNGKCTRGQVVTFLWRANGSPEVSANVSFSDVKTGAYYEKAVKWAVANKITEGTGAGKFSPDATCTRAQVVTFLFRAQK